VDGFATFVGQIIIEMWIAFGAVSVGLTFVINACLRINILVKI
jgi:hypothetical protein